MTFAGNLSLSLTARLATWTVHGLVRTCRISISGQEAIEELKRRHVPVIYIYWHRHIFFFIYHFRRARARPLISLSSDGALVAKIAHYCGLSPIRGSSSRGGLRAFREMIDSLTQRGEDVLITADGPKGPARIIKDGVLKLAQITSLPVVPISWYGSRRKIFRKSWDRFLMPLPFCRIHMAYGPPLHLSSWPTEGSPEWEKIRQSWQAALNRQEDEARERVGQSREEEAS